MLQHLNKLNLESSGIKVYKNLIAPLPLPKLSTTGEPRPYRSQDDTAGNGVKFTDRILTARQSKWDMDIDYEEYRNKYLNDGTDQPFAKWIVQQVAASYLAAINNKTMYLGVYNAAGTGAVDVATGFGTIIAAEITATNLTPITTGALTTSNTVAGVELVTESMPAWAKDEGGPVYCSYATLEKYKKNYRTSYGYNFNKNEMGMFQLDNSKFWLEPASWMNNSQRIIATLKSNLAVGVEGTNVKVAASARRNVIETRPMFPIGFEIADLECLAVNEQV